MTQDHRVSGEFRSRVGECHTRRMPLVAFNIVDVASLLGVLDASARVGEAVIVQFSASTVQYYGAQLVAAMVRAAVRDVARSSAPESFLHLDHCRDDAVIEAAIDAGFDGIMADGSHLSYEENAAWTKRWVDAAHAAGVLVEGELGAIRGQEDGIAGADRPDEVTVAEYVAFAEETGVDLLGTDIGTAHGVYDEPPELAFPFLEQLAERDPGAGFVVHGGSGLAPHVLSRLADCRVAKVNFSTDLKIAWWTGLSAALAGTHPPQPLTGLDGARAAVRRMALERLGAFRGDGTS